METALLVAIFFSIFSCFLPTEKQWRAAQDKARERRLADDRMNARLLRFNI
jgi:hypothetical protein